MTFTLPEDLAAQFLKRVPASARSRYVADALVQKPAERERRLIQACEAANRQRDVRRIEKEFDALSGDIAEPWSDAPAR